MQARRATIKAAWDWHMPRSTADQERKLVEFAAALGFDTLVLRDPGAGLVRMAHDEGLRVVTVVSPTAPDAFAREHPGCLQRMLAYEEAIEAALEETRGREQGQRLAHRWFPLIQRGRLVCYAQQESRSFLKELVSRALEAADGVAFDGFGFKNHYACFCDTCARAHRAEDPHAVARHSEQTLVEVSEVLFEHAKAEKPDSIVMNHVWPPFNPNPYYGARLRLDYCTQTISWFYRPSWGLQRVELEAAEHRRLQIPGRNRFVPFIGLYADPYQLRNAERVERELEIALRYGDGHLTLCTLEGPLRDEAIRAVVKATLRG
jgi:hypothetical protein